MAQPISDLGKASDDDTSFEDLGASVEDDDSEESRHLSGRRVSAAVRRNTDDEISRRRGPRAESARGTTGSLREGSVLGGKYRIERVVARGAGGTLLDATHLGLHQQVSIRAPSRDASRRPEVTAHFLRDARTAAQIQSEHAARVLDVGRLDSGLPYAVTEFLDGWDLGEVLRVRGPLPVQEAVDYVVQASEAVAEAHALGIRHGALSLGSLVLTRRADGSPFIKVRDFGLPPVIHPTIRMDESTLASSGIPEVLPFVAPEQLRDPEEVDERADVWALGVVLHMLLSGASPFRARTTLALLAAIAADPPVELRAVRDDIAEELDAVVQGCLSKDPRARYASVAEFLAALRPYASGDGLASIDRASRAVGRSTRPPPLPLSARSQAIVPIARPKTAPPRSAPSPAAGASRSGWMVAVGMLGAGFGALAAVLAESRAPAPSSTMSSTAERAPISAPAAVPVTEAPLPGGPPPAATSVAPVPVRAAIPGAAPAVVTPVVGPPLVPTIARKPIVAVKPSPPPPSREAQTASAAPQDLFDDVR